MYLHYELVRYGFNYRKVGNSLAIRIPQNLAKELQISEGEEIEISAIDGNLVVKPRKRKEYSLDELLEGITPENLHAGVDFGEPVGNEVW
ncbi:MAG: AbrB/MazE/SpoVT family DNA-binding domain-containing protein [Plectolyngbya sp. WJT66-NPBG17]|jgi:antitoxin MazE|nr:AbrB/MazE/SpoVT family DNA-binding domain-containing protein [Plectolyngbya sp. WJT66-NPBG17]MBW4524710.1 AbrB/MazE/SpoVT family DNA-binding domain-containing protein [Phormidium tanganyikae FI6-MK23]